MVRAIPAYHAVYLVAFFQKELTQVAAVLTSHTCNQCFLHIMFFIFDKFLTQGLLQQFDRTARDANFAGKPTGNDCLVFPYHVGQLSLIDSLLVHYPL